MDRFHLEDFLPYRFSRMSAELSRLGSQIYGDAYGLTVAEWRTLVTVGELSETTSSEIGKHSSMHKTMVSRAVSALENRRWLKRRISKDDRRVEFLTLTLAGQTALSHLAPQMKDFETEIIFRLNKSDQHALMQSLSALESALGFNTKDKES